MSRARPAHLETLELRERAPFRLGARDPLQPGGIEQVLHDRQFEIDGALLEHHPEPAQRLRGPVADLDAEDPDGAGAVVVEPGDQAEQRGLAGAVLAEQHREAAGRDLETDVVQGATLAEAVAQALDFEGALLLTAPFARSRACLLPAQDRRLRHRLALPPLEPTSSALLYRITRGRRFAPPMIWRTLPANQSAPAAATHLACRRAALRPRSARNAYRVIAR